MSNASSIFNSTFFVFLGIIVLIVGLLIIYFENKSREQNHKISSMLSLVSSLAEELNMVKFHLNRMNMVGAGMSNLSVPVTTNIPINSSETNNLGERLIEVSDDDDDEDDDDDDDEDEDEDDDDDDDNDEDDGDDNDEDDDDEDDDEISITELPLDDIKILNINDLKVINNSDEEDDDDEDDDEDDDGEDETMNGLDDDDLTMNDIDDIDEETNELINRTTTFDIEELEIAKSEIKTQDYDNNKEITLLNLEKSKNIEVIDYKKLSLNKLRSVVLEKGLVTDSSKLKKNELFKLLGVE